MGAVYKVWDLQRNVPLAMKVLRSDMMEDPSVFKYFKREARALQKLAHPNIVTFYGMHHTDDLVFMLQRYINGPSLQQILKKNPNGLPLSEALSYMSALCAALGYAHYNGVVHCDIKPANVMLDLDGNIYLADFGIARHADSTTTTIAGSGTPAYMAPEQITVAAVTPATDIYALGLLLYEMLTGKKPFRGDETALKNKGDTAGERIRYAHMRLSPPDPREINSAIPPRASEIILRCLEKAPAKRYISTVDLLADLQTLNVSFNARAAIIPPEFTETAEKKTTGGRPKTNITSKTSASTGYASRPSAQAPSPSKAAPVALFAGGFISLVILGIAVLGVILFAVFSGGTQAVTIQPTTPVTKPFSTSPSNNIVQEPTNISPTEDDITCGTRTNQKDGAILICVPAGEFTMGSDISNPDYPGYEDPNRWEAESPMHQVYLDEYKIYKTEVTNEMYQKCVSAKKCTLPKQIPQYTHSDYYSNLKFANHPVILVDWNQAQTYCEWAGAELPTEAQWEKSARGTGLNLYPWGDNSNSGSTLEVGGTSQVGSSLLDVSPYGVFDMAGNVSEWVFDVKIMYPSTLQYNPKISSGDHRHIVRGGNYIREAKDGSFRVSVRTSVAPNETANTRGFRCAVNP
jgi:serine/threonine protein kinase